MYFKNFPTITYDFPLRAGKEYKLVADISRNVRLRKFIADNIALYDYYDWRDGDTPEIISEKAYGSPFFHWVVMLVNQRYDYVADFPLTQTELDDYILEQYGSRSDDVHHYKWLTDTTSNLVRQGANVLTFVSNVVLPVGTILSTDLRNDGIQDYSYRGVVSAVVDNRHTVSIREGRFEANDTLFVGLGTETVTVATSSIPQEIIPVTNRDYEYKQNEAKRRIKLIAPELIPVLVSELGDAI